MSQAIISWPSRARYLVALGANLPSAHGAPETTQRRALDHMEQYSCKTLDVSRFFSCPSFPAGNGPDYVNAAAAIEGPGDPRKMLEICHQIEKDFGRERKKRWGQRVLDLDLLAFGDIVYPDPETYALWRALPLEEQMQQTPERLILPHPRMQERAFVLVPLADIAPDWLHPVLDLTVTQMRDRLPAALLEEMRPIQETV